MRIRCLLALFLVSAASVAGVEPQPEHAVPAILSLFKAYQLVAMDAAHRMKDMDDFILTLVRNPEFPNAVDDIVVECGNALYQPVLDRYISGEDVPFSQARDAWRKWTSWRRRCSRNKKGL